MNEFEELTHALVHQAEACYLTNVNHQRIHAYSMIAGLAGLESRLIQKKQAKAAEAVEKSIDTCIMCIKTTATTGKCYKCTKDELRKIEENVHDIAHSEWRDILKNSNSKKTTKSHK
ncbi:MAG: hypothetical protein QXO69_00100 [archaeon]